MLPIIKGEYVYRSGDVIAQAFPDLDVLSAAYLRLKDEGLLGAYFHELETIPTAFEWLQWCMESKAVMFAAHLWINNEMTPIGVVKVSPPRSTHGYERCEVGMIFFREYQHRTWTIPACQLMIEWMFDRTNTIALYGTIPEHNRASRMFMKAIGFGSIERPIPMYTVWNGEPCGAYVSWITATEWATRSPFQL